MALTLEQKKAIALAKARRRRRQRLAEAEDAPLSGLPPQTLGTIGALETAVQIGMGLPALIASGIAGAGAAIVPGGRTGAEAVRRVQEASAETFQPRTEAGEKISQAVGKVAEAGLKGVRLPIAGIAGIGTAVAKGSLSEAADTVREITEEGVGTVLGDVGLEATGSPAVATGLQILPEAVALIFGGRKLTLGIRGKPTQQPIQTVKPRIKAKVQPIEKTAQKMAEVFKEQSKVPTVDELFKSGSAAFKRADKAGVKLTEESTTGFAQQLARTLKEEGIDPVLHPKASRALERIVSDSEGGLSFKNVETLRRIAKDAAGSIEKADRRFGARIIDSIDEYIAQLDASQATGNVNLAKRSITAARDFWSRASKGELLEGLVERAGIRAGQFSGSGFENALRTEFRQLALNKKRMRGFTKNERLLIERVAAGGAVANALRFVGKFAPRGVISTAITAGGGAAIGGPLGAISVIAVAEIARKGATRATRTAATRAAEAARRGGG